MTDRKIPPENDLAKRMWEIRHCEVNPCRWEDRDCDCRDHAKRSARDFWAWYNPQSIETRRPYWNSYGKPHSNAVPGKPSECGVPLEDTR